MDVEWDEFKRSAVLKQRRVDILQAALIFDGPTLTRVDDRRDSGELREISIGMVEASASSSSTPTEAGRPGSSRHGKVGAMRSSDIRRASLDEIRAMKDRGELSHDALAPTGGEALDAEFWAKARLVEPRSSTRSVHLKIDADVFEFFKAGGKGHVTRMQDVLKAYVRAHRTA